MTSQENKTVGEDLCRGLNIKSKNLTLYLKTKNVFN